VIPNFDQRIQIEDNEANLSCVCSVQDLIM